MPRPSDASIADVHDRSPSEALEAAVVWTSPVRPLEPEPEVVDEVAAGPWWARAGTRPRLAPGDVREHTWRSALARTTLLATVVAAAWWVLATTEIRAVESVGGNGEAHLQTTTALIGGCGPIYTSDDAGTRSGLVAEHRAGGAPNRQEYDTIVPMYGPFWDAPVTGDQAFWERTAGDVPQPENLLANAWQGDLVVYYGPAATAAEVDALRSLTRRGGAAGDQVDDLRLRVVPWPTARGSLPGGRAFAFVAWNHSQTCHHFMASALEDFRRAAPAVRAPGHDGTRPPVHLSAAP